MIEQMVASLAERLKQNGADPEGWERLVRSYAVLGRKDDARRALIDGRKALAGDGPALARIDALAKSLGIEG
jgi:cytochrome c-type biogenesis protein CcmH